MKKTFLNVGVALVATMFQFANDIYPTTQLILRHQLCAYEFQDVKKNLQKNDLTAYTNEKELENFFIQIKNSYCQKNQ
ncbi:MAG: hypothetical protein GW794_13650 [Flavobacteriales bacterium]|nr:hypothetical protein [Bacteroidota bacterium]NCQ58864.1 hypothetical protein [Flavobacteriales bacterium]NCT16513.1 hypothetical protein [Flavobacteriales bacterium]